MADEERATRAALQRWVDMGSDLSRPMEVDFFVAVPSEAVGKQVASQARGLGFSTNLSLDEETRKWTCYCTKTIIPEYATVRGIEIELDELARPLGGYSDGFGSYGNAENSS